MLTLKQGIKLSAIVDKLNLKIENPNATQEEVGANLIMQIISKAHFAENEIYSLVMDYKKCTSEEAENIDLIEFVTTLTKESGFANFFKSAVR